MSDLSLSLSPDGSALPSLFFRAADRLRLEGCVAAICQEGRSLALSSQHDAALDHYGQLLVARLRQAAPGAQLEVYFPTNTDAMLTRFNEALAQQSLRQAMQEQGRAAGQGTGQSEPASPAAEKIWLVHDAGALAEHELQLLARLVTNFPGANIRVVLLLGGSTRSRKAFDSLGRRIVRWDIEGPTPEQAQAMLAQARNDGCEGLVSDLLQKIQPALSAPVRGRTPLVDGDDLQALGLAATTEVAGQQSSQASPFALSAHEALQRRQTGNTAKATKASQATKATKATKSPSTFKAPTVLSRGIPLGQRFGLAVAGLRRLPWRRLAALLLAVSGWALRHAPRALGGLVTLVRQRAGWVAVIGALGLGSVAVASWLHPNLFSRKSVAAEPAAAKAPAKGAALKPSESSADSRETARMARRSAEMITESKP